MKNQGKLKIIAGLVFVMFLTASVSVAGAEIKKDDLKKAAAVVALTPLALQREKPKPPQAEVPKVEIPGMEKLNPPANKKEAQEAKKAEKEKAAAQAESVAEAFRTVQDMAESGEIQAQYILGYAYYTGQQIKESDEAALGWWKKAAKQRHREADAYIGLSFAESFQNQDEAIRRYKRAAEKGSSFAELLLGICGYRLNTPESKREAIRHFQTASGKGNPMAQTFLEVILKKGIDAKQDFGRNINWKKEAKKTLLVDLYTQAGVNAFKGQITPQSDEGAVKWWELAASMGDAKAQALLGAAYYTGRGIGEDYAKAVELLKLAAAKGEPLAEFTLGKAYYEGNGVRKNNDKAKELFRSAGNKGIAEGKRMADQMEGRRQGRSTLLGSG